MRCGVIHGGSGYWPKNGKLPDVTEPDAEPIVPSTILLVVGSDLLVAVMAMFAALLESENAG